MPKITSIENDQNDVSRVVVTFEKTTPQFRKNVREWLERHFAAHILKAFWRYASDILVIVFKRGELAFGRTSVCEELRIRALFV